MIILDRQHIAYTKHALNCSEIGEGVYLGLVQNEQVVLIPSTAALDTGHQLFIGINAKGVVINLRLNRDDDDSVIYYRALLGDKMKVVFNLSGNAVRDALLRADYIKRNLSVKELYTVLNAGPYTPFESIESIAELTALAKTITTDNAEIISK